MKLKLTFSCVAVALSCVAAIAGGVGDKVTPQHRQNIYKTATNLHCYEPEDSSVTAPPKGYKPFYISHIGRHGSRAHSTDKRMRAMLKLEKFHSKGLLTEQAESLYVTMKGIEAANEATGYGNLTSRGAREHRGIARRMANHYPEVFSNAKASNISCYSTKVSRVVESMENFTGQLAAMYPRLNIRKSITGKTRNRVKNETNVGHLTPENRATHDSVDIYPYIDSMLRSLDCSRLVAKTFKSGKIPSEIKGREANFFRDIHLGGCNRQCFDNPGLGWVEPYFTDDEMCHFALYNNIKCSNNWMWTEENGGVKVYAAAGILNCMIEDAEASIAGSDTCATLRFSHDGHIIPLLCLMGVEGCDFRGSFTDVGRQICIGSVMPMGGNIQLIFFRNKKGSVLVKFVHNDRETTIPALKPVYKGVFYDWNNVKAWFASRMEPYAKMKACAREINIKGKVSANGVGLQGVLVSDGDKFTQTDSEGNYAFKSHKKWANVFVVTPSGFVAECADGLQPSFWKKLRHGEDVCEVCDFKLVPQDQKEYSMLFVTDMHLCNAGTLKPDKKHFEEAILPLLKHFSDSISNLRPTYMMNLGDLSHDRYWYENKFTIADAYKYLKDQKFPSPLYSVTGNHDHDPAIYTPNKAEEEFRSSHLYRKFFGPDHYSFNAGGDHWVVMNDAQYLNTPGNDLCAKGIVGARNYDRTYTKAQMKWLKKDLSYVPEGSQVYLCSHIPVIKTFGPVLPPDVLDELEAMFAARKLNVTMFAGHSHRFYMAGDDRWPHIKVYTLPATSGDMWQTASHGRSINLGGSIAGMFYGKFSAAEPDDFRYVTEEGWKEQYCRAYDMNEVRKFMKKDSLMRVSIPQLGPSFAYDDAKWKNTVMVNCWWYRKGDKVEMWEDGKALEVVLDRTLPDPLTFSWIMLFKDPMRPDAKPAKVCKELVYDSIFVAKSSSAKKPVKVRITCADGKVFEFTLNRPAKFDRFVK